MKSASEDGLIIPFQDEYYKFGEQFATVQSNFPRAFMKDKTEVEVTIGNMKGNLVQLEKVWDQIFKAPTFAGKEITIRLQDNQIMSGGIERSYIKNIYIGGIKGTLEEFQTILQAAKELWSSK